MIPRGTTPTLIFTYNTVPVNTITDAYLTITSRGEKIIEKDLSEAVIGQKTLSWTLTQEETLAIEVNAKIEIQCRYKTADGYAGVSKLYEEKGGRILKDGVI